MGAIEKFLSRHKRFGADTMVFIYHLEDHPTYAPLTEKIFETWEKGHKAGVTSVITLLEVLVKPKRDGNREAVKDYWELLTTFPNLQIVEIDLALVNMASDLRAQYDLRTPDALQIASAQRVGATGFITNDERLQRVKEIEVALLDKML